MSDFREFCRGLTDTQLQNVVEKERDGKERDPDREADYRDAREEAAARGLDL